MTPEQRKTLLANLKPKAEDIKALPKQAADELFREAEAAADFKRKNKLLTLYPETGPLRRELYPKHMAFFRAGKSYNERAVIAGNRCSDAFTPIEMGPSTRLISELLGEESFYVNSWDGTTRCKKKAGGVFLKGIEPMFRLHWGDGYYFDCTRNHRLLTESGWASLDRVLLFSCGLLCTQKVEDYLANYVEDGYHDGAQLPHQSGLCLESLPSQGDAQGRRCHRHDSEDEGDSISQYILLCEGRAHPSTLDDPEQIAALCAQFRDPASLPGAQQWKGVRQELQRYVSEYGHQLASEQSAYYPPYEGHPLDVLNGYHGAEDSHEGLSLECLGVSLSTRWIPAGQSKQEFLHVAARRQTFDCYVPYRHPRLVGGKQIHSIECIGFQPVLDFTVEDTHCYEVGSVVHHNTGKSFGIGGYETALHLTGLYPPFWEGRRFHYPIEAWVAGDTSETTRDIIQQILLGNPGELGTGLIPYDCILGNPTHRAGVAGAVDTVRVRHVSGGTSWCGFKCFAPGTLVTMSNEALKKVEDVAVGEAVLCAGGSVFPVSATFHYPAAPLVRIRAQLGEITVTPNHKMFTQRGGIPAAELTILDQLELGTIPGEFDQICSIDLLGPSEVYCIEVESKHELIANGYRVSNSYDQGRAKFQGTSKDLVWLDESAPLDVYTECLTRLLTRNGIIMLTFTPLDGITDVVLKYLPHMAPDTEDDNIGVDLV
jgi:phage terminase large subunit-like protein